jgi:hypothetical protein
MGDVDNTELGNKISGKEISKKSMIFAAVWVVVLTIAKGVLAVFGKDFLAIGDIIASGVAVVGVFSPIVMSVWLEKIKDIFDTRKQG